MSRQDEPVDRASVLFSAHLTIDAHAAGRSCQCCTPDGCRQLTWAKRTDPEYVARTTPTHRPAASDDRQSKERTHAVRTPQPV